MLTNIAMCECDRCARLFLWLYGHIRCGSGKLRRCRKKRKREKREAPADRVDVDCDTFEIKNITPICIQINFTISLVTVKRLSVTLREKKEKEEKAYQINEKSLDL